MAAGILIYYPGKATARMQYVLDWIFREQFRIPFTISVNRQEWMEYEGPKINYSTSAVQEKEIKMVPAGLLGETGNISPKALAIQRWKKTTVLFYNQPGADVPFDLFSAVFYLISRYEEYLPHKKDRHGRFLPSESAACRYHFLQDPAVDQWLYFFRELLQERFDVQLHPKPFQCVMTFDIDLAWKYLHKGIFRYWGGQWKDFFLGKWSNIRDRNAVVSGKQQDPFFTFPELDLLHQQYQLKPLYFLLLGRPGKFDKNADPGSKGMKSLMRLLSEKYPVGIHPSYGSHQDPAILDREIKILSDAVQKPVTRSRQHFIKFSLPETYQRLIRAGITDDYSMGYAALNGFRAGTSRPFLWYDLSKEATTRLRIHPFAFMDATSVFYLKHKPEEWIKEWKRLYQQVKQTGGDFVSIWHNFILYKGSPGLKAYKDLLEHARANVKLAGSG